jgi:hypothetical protein
MSELQTHQQRVVNEKQELDKKIIALCSFIHSDGYYMAVPDYTERIHIQLQFRAMVDYSHSLSERISKFNQGN